MLASVVAAFLAVLAGVRVGIIKPGLSRSRASRADRRSGRTFAS
jgi:hypothetical protein